MANTPRGYPVFTGGTAPAGPAQMQQLANAIDADVTATEAALAATATADRTELDTRVKALEQSTKSALVTSNAALYGPRGGAYTSPQIIRQGKERRLQGSFTNVVTINFDPGVEYPLLTLAEGDRPQGTQVYSVWATPGTAHIVVKASGVVALVVSGGTHAGGAWAIDLSTIGWLAS